MKKMCRKRQELGCMRFETANVSRNFQAGEQNSAEKICTNSSQNDAEKV